MRKCFETIVNSNSCYTLIINTSLKNGKTLRNIETVYILKPVKWSANFFCPTVLLRLSPIIPCMKLLSLPTGSHIKPVLF